LFSLLVGCSSPCTANPDTDCETDKTCEDNDTTHAVVVTDGDEHPDSEPEQHETGHKPERDETQPAVVDSATVVRL